MPELPEVETVRTGLEDALKGATIKKVELKRANLRFEFPEHFAKKLTGATIESIGRRAKYLLFHLDNCMVLIGHLGMTGRFSVEKPPKTYGKHDHVVFTLTDGRAVIYNDARRFGFMTLSSEKELSENVFLADLGPEPLEKEFSAKYLEIQLLRRSGPIKTVIMGQGLVVGVGNIYASEALFLAKIDPRKPAKKVADNSAELVKAIRAVLKDAIKSGGSSLRDFVQVSGESGYFQHHFNVYGRAGKPCITCHTPIKNLRMAGRSTFYCPHCQK